jgi:hypothetical protein
MSAVARKGLLIVALIENIRHGVHRLLIGRDLQSDDKVPFVYW